MLAESLTPGSLLWLAATRWRVAADHELAELGVTHAQYVVLSTLLGMGPRGQRPNQRSVADEAGLDPLFVSKLVAALERQGLVHRTRDPSDARSIQLTLTEEGVATAREAAGVMRQLHEVVFAGIGGLHGPAVAELVDSLRELLATSLPAR
ncbi:MarR family winged helix-turn-helix transcriptional regulator [Desertimonas flava]|uniref:MarR family winged helix-turn-helix transcriptional regulator n=1 Tax=Desertimonas flava TaxID=2064846 RepID=UPI000E34A7FE|nr:MarR family transcriptional regulator [Desertimonas flava]